MSTKLVAVPSLRYVPFCLPEPKKAPLVVNPNDWTIDNEAHERLQFLNQEITDLRAELDAVEDWDLYESAALKYQIIVYADERSKMASDFRRKTERKIREAEDEAWKINAGMPSSGRADPLRDEIDWVCAKIRELILSARTARAHERREVGGLVSSYRKYWEELMITSGRMRAVGHRRVEDQEHRRREPTDISQKREDDGVEKGRAGRKGCQLRKLRRAPTTRCMGSPMALSVKMVSLLTTLARLK